MQIRDFDRLRILISIYRVKRKANIDISSKKYRYISGKVRRKKLTMRITIFLLWSATNSNFKGGENFVSFESS